MYEKKGVIGVLLVIIMISVGTLLITPAITKHQGSELAMAIDNLNLLVKVQIAYGRINSAVSHTTGKMGGKYIHIEC